MYPQYYTNNEYLIGLIVITAYNLGKLWLFTENARDPTFPVCSIDAVEFFEDAGYFYNVTLELTPPNDKTYVISATISGGKSHKNALYPLRRSQ